MKNFQLLVLATFIIILNLALTENSSAATFTVTNVNDSGAGSLRQAVLTANGNSENDTITFDPALFSSPQTITLTGGQLVIEPDNSLGMTKTLTINGSGANLLTISGNNQSRVISIERLARAIISDVKITGGNGVGGSDFAGSGGGILVKGGFLGDGVNTLILKNSIVRGNQSLTGSGGGLFLSGENTIINTLVADNNTPTLGGGIDANIFAVARIINSTISGNSTGVLGGGLFLYGSKVYLTNSTVAFNRITTESSGNPGAGIYIQSSSSITSYLYARNSIVARNSVAGIYLPDINGNLTSEGYNIFANRLSDFQQITGDTTGNQYFTDPKLDSVLRNNGGIIPTLAPNVNSPAIDRADNCVLNTPAGGGCLELNITADQRGVPRPQDGDNNGTAIVDIGAFEVSAAETANVPNMPDLNNISDSGTSDSDDITNSRNLLFEVTQTTIGATVEFFRGAEKIGEKIAAGNTVSFSDNIPPANNVVSYSSRQIVNGVTSLPSAALSVTIDTTAPMVTIDQSIGQGEPTNTQPINFTVTFNEKVEGFTSDDVSLAGSTAGVASAAVTVTGSNSRYNVAVSNITSDGIVRAVVLANAALDVAGNLSSVSTSIDNTVTLDTVSPTVTINQAASQADPATSSTVNFTVVFSEPVTEFNNADVSLAGSTANVSAASISVTGSGTTYNVAVNNITSNGGFVRAIVAGAAATDAAGNLSSTSTSTDNTITVDNVAPTVTINQAANQPDPTVALPVNFTVVFSEAVTGFDRFDVSLVGSTVNTSGAAIDVTGSGTTYNVAVSNFTSNGGVLRASVRSGAATDAIGLSSSNSTSTDNGVTVDNVAPAVTINQAINQSDPASTQPINFTVVFSESVTGFNAADVSLVGSTANVSSANVTVTGSGNVYNVSISNITSSGQVRASVTAGAAQDAAGNLSSVSTSSDNTVTVNANVNRALFDFDGDGKADISVFRPSAGAWYLNQSTAGFTGISFGQQGDLITPADYDGDGKTDIAVFRAGTFYRLNSSNGQFIATQFGQSGDLPVAGDFDGDSKADLAVFRPSNGAWYRINSGNGGFVAVQFGQAGDKPQVADFDGDGKTDLAVFRPSVGGWYILRSSDGAFYGTGFGQAGDIATAADFDGDAKADIAVFRPSNGTWYRINSANNQFVAVGFGTSEDTPAAADYDGDGKADIAVFRPSAGSWYLLRSSTGFTGIQFGTNGDVPTPAAFGQ